jgi:prepilin-type N-terminal cleavage/methylation domain-containing protein
MKKLRGFTLIELAIVLVILGILGSFGLPALTATLQRDRQLKTQDHNLQIFTALASFVLQNNRLPCPADPSATSDSFGIERSSCTTFESQAIGLIPYKTLGLPESVSKDGYKNWITYAVNPDLTSGIQRLNDDGSDPEKAFCSKESPSLKVKDANQSLLIDHEKDAFAVVLINHGPDGRGSFIPGENLQKKEGVKGDEIENTNGDLLFIDRPFSKNPASPFHHTVTWVSRRHLVTYYGKGKCFAQAPLQENQQENEHQQVPQNINQEPPRVQFNGYDY